MRKDKCESRNDYGIVFKREGNKSLYCKCLACPESNVTSYCMLCMIQHGIIRYYTTHFLRNAIMHNDTFGINQCQLVSLINFSHCLWGFHFQSRKPTWHGHGICQQPFFFLFSILVVSSGSLSLKLSYYNTQSVSQMQFMLQQGV